MSFDKYGRIDWQTLWLSLAYIVSQRSIDPKTKHGCIFVSQKNQILNIGYNGGFANIDDDNIPLTRPEKYSWIKHAEENAMLNAAEQGISLSNSICYVTGMPCERCLRGILSINCSKIIYGVCNSQMLTDEMKENIKKMTDLCNVEFIYVDNFESTIQLFNQTLTYLQKKTEGDK